MTSAIPHSAAIRRDADSYLEDAISLLVKELRGRTGSQAFRHIYKTTLACDCLLAKLPNSAKPSRGVLRSVVQQVPILAACNEESVAQVQLRRFVECVFWVVYFSEHGIEWLEFSRDPGARIEKDLTKPISFSAHREPSYYRHYARERLSKEPSGLAIAAVGTLSTEYSQLSAAAHGAKPVRSGKLVPPLGAMSEDELRTFAEKYRSIASASCIVLAAFFRNQFDRLPASNREWFDWLIGTDRRRKIREGQFGIIR